MKIRNPLLIRAASWLGAQLVRGWMRTIRCHYRPLGPNLDPRQEGMTARYIYAFWHENMLLPLSQYARPDIHVLISKHADGQLIAQLARHLGFAVVHGSTTREGIKAVRQMLRLSQNAHLAFTPDGPRGPRRQVQPGLVYLASRTGLPIVPAGIGFARAWRMRSWDRFAVPRPFSWMTCVTPEPIVVPAEADRDELEIYRRRVEDALMAMGNLAEQWAETGTWPGSPDSCHCTADQLPL
jgi:hypothetical protein